MTDQHHKDSPLPLIPLTEETQGTQPQPFTNLNPAFNIIADAQNIPAGSWDWILGGPAPWTGSSGQAACDGWTHAHKLKDDYRKAVIANYCHRRTFYNGAPHRQYGPPYPAAGRPDGWTPEAPGDNPDGTVTLLGPNATPLILTGLDVEHFWLNPLFELIDDNSPITLNTPLGDIQSNDLARSVTNYYLRSLAGQIRDPNDPLLPVSWTFGDRANSRILDTLMEANARPGAIELWDATTLDLWLRDAMLPFYESGAGISHFPTAKQPPATFTIGCFNGLYWILPVCYWAAKEMPNSSSKTRLESLVSRWAQWALDLELQYPDRGFNMSRVHVDRVLMRGPLSSIAPLLDNNSAVWDLGWELYTFRANAVAAEVTGAPELQRTLDRKKKQYANSSKPEHLVWLVDPDGTPI